MTKIQLELPERHNRKLEYLKEISTYTKRQLILKAISQLKLTQNDLCDSSQSLNNVNKKARSILSNF